MEVSEIKFHEMVDKAWMVINQPKSKNAKKSPFIGVNPRRYSVGMS